MIEIKDWITSGFPAAITGMRLPYKSTGNADSFFDFVDFNDLTPQENDIVSSMAETYPNEMVSDQIVHEDTVTVDCQTLQGYSYFKIGEKDHKLAMSLSNAGKDHGKFLRMIHCQVLVKAPLYWWKEMDTYKVGTTANSESSMHTIAKKEFELDDFSFEHLDDGMDLKTCGEYTTKELTPPYTHLWNTISLLNANRQAYLETKDKNYWWQMIQLLPASYNQTRMLDLNYQTLQNVYRARKGHKLDEWHAFCNWIEEALPYSELITGHLYEPGGNYEGE